MTEISGCRIFTPYAVSLLPYRQKGVNLKKYAENPTIAEEKAVFPTYLENKAKDLQKSGLPLYDGEREQTVPQGMRRDCSKPRFISYQQNIFDILLLKGYYLY